jgi:hypothetical protein
VVPLDRLLDRFSLVFYDYRSALSRNHPDEDYWMARRVINRRELRVSDAYLQDMKELEESEKQRKRATRASAKPRPKKTAKAVRLKAYWAVINSAGQEVAEFNYAQQTQAQQKAVALIEAKRSHHFVRLAKKEIDD